MRGASGNGRLRAGAPTANAQKLRDLERRGRRVRVPGRYLPLRSITNFASSSISSGVSLVRCFGILLRSPNSSG